MACAVEMSHNQASAATTSFGGGEEENAHDFLKADIGSHQSTDALLAYELNQLSLKERDMINEEVHGVRDQKYLVQESPALLRDSLERLTTELTVLEEKYPQNTAYNISQTKYKDTTWVNTEEFRLMFLRHEFFDPKKAAARLVAFLELVQEYFGDFGLEREICLSDLSENDRKYLDAGYLQVLPGRDRSGRRIFGHFSGDVVKDLFDPARPNENFIDSRIKVAIYMSLRIAKDDVDVQRSGVVMIFWMHEIRIDDLKVRSFVHKRVVRAILIRVNALHCYIPPSGNTQLLNMVKAMFLLAIGSELRSRVRIHVGSATECCYSMQTFGIQSSQLPINKRKSERQDANHRKWLEQQSIREEYIKNKKEFKGIECPRHSDILFGRGWPIRKHAGNTLFRYVLEQRREEYNNAKRNRGRKTMVAASVVRELKESHGSRFLRQDNKCGGFWFEVSDESAREKVSVGFRDMRKPKDKGVKGESGNVSDTETTSSKRKCDDEGSIMSSSQSPLPMEEDALVNGPDLSNQQSNDYDQDINKHYAFISTEGKRQRLFFGTDVLGLCQNDDDNQNSGIDDTPLERCSFKWV